MNRELINDYAYDGKSGNPAVYVGTYHKYNCGSIAGAWIDLTNFSDYDDFLEVCRQIHDDEDDPELMFQDFENFPSQYYEECHLDFDEIIEYAELDSYESEAFQAYLDNCDGNAQISDFKEAYCGNFDSEKDYAEHFIEETGMLYDVPDDLARYFDYEAFARDLFMDHTFVDGFVFRPI